jgi:BolA protein
MISQKIKSEIKNILFFELIDESSHHKLNQKESHFKITLVSDTFLNLTLLERHRLMNTLLKEELTSIHAISYHLYTEKEWKGKSPISPKCVKNNNLDS